MSHADHFGTTIGNRVEFRVRLNTVTQKLRKFREQGTLKFDYLACSGLSGLIFASPLSLNLDCPLIVVRKKDDECASPYVVEGAPSYDPFRYLFIDELIFLGRTRKRVKEKLSQHPYNGTWGGAVIYGGREGTPIYFYNENMRGDALFHQKSINATKRKKT